MTKPMTEQIIINGVDVSGCEFSTISSNELKCLAEDKDVHTCLKITEKTKCPIYRLKMQLQRKTAEYEKHTKYIFELLQTGENYKNKLQKATEALEKIKQALEQLKKDNEFADTILQRNFNKLNSKLKIATEIFKLILNSREGMPTIRRLAHTALNQLGAENERQI